MPQLWCMIDDLTALRLQLDWGVDEALGSVPVDRFNRVAAFDRSAVPPQLQAGAEAQAMMTPVAKADPIGVADTIDALYDALDRFTACPLRATATNTVRPAGVATATVVLIGDAPGNDDDRSGRAFSGPAGVIIDRVMGSIGLTRADLLLTTLVPWRPPGNRPPSDSEIQACLPFLHRLLTLVQPRAVILAGSGPVTALTGQTGTIRQLRGRWLELFIASEQIKLSALPILPFAQWFRDGGTKQQLWSDLLLLRKAVTTG